MVAPLTGSVDYNCNSARQSIDRRALYCKLFFLVGDFSWFSLIYYPNEPFYFITSIWTVDLLMPNFCAAARTVVRFSMM